MSDRWPDVECLILHSAEMPEPARLLAKAMQVYLSDHQLQGLFVPDFLGQYTKHFQQEREIGPLRSIMTRLVQKGAEMFPNTHAWRDDGTVVWLLDGSVLCYRWLEYHLPGIGGLRGMQYILAYTIMSEEAYEQERIVGALSS